MLRPSGIVFTLCLTVSLAVADDTPAVTWSDIPLTHLDAHVVAGMFASKSLPLSGVARVVALASERKLLVEATSKGLEELVKLVRLLDRPVTRVKVEYWLVRAKEKALAGEFKPQLLSQNTIVMSMREDIGTKLEELKTKDIAKVMLHTSEADTCNKPFVLSTVAAADNSTSAHQLIITPEEDGLRLTVFPREERPRSPAGSPAQTTTHLTVSLAYGTAVVFTAPGFSRGDDMFLVLRVTVAK